MLQYEQNLEKNKENIQLENENFIDQDEEENLTRIIEPLNL